MNRRIVYGACLAFVVVVAGAFHPTRAAGPAHFTRGRPFDITHIKLVMRVSVEDKTVDSIARVDGIALRRLESLRFDAVDFDVEKVRVQLADAAPVACDVENDGEHLTLDLPRPLATGEKASVEIEYHLSDPSRGLNFFGPTKEDDTIPYVMWSQGQSITNRYWVPCFDHPNEMQTTEIVCTVDRPYIAISNGRLLGVEENNDNTHTYHWLQDKPHVSYLMTLVVGDFVSKTDTWRGKPVTYYVRKKFEDQINNSFGNTLRMLDFFSDKIGVEYPWDKYTQVCCYQFGGGMENTSSTTLGERTLHDDRAHLDTSSDGLVAHEMAHQWWGDLLTCKEWAHIWLNEGFASYFEALWAEENLGPEEFAYNMSRKAAGAISGGKTKPIVYREYGHPGEQFDSRAYPKGAWVLHMIRRRLGDSLFWKAINTYCTRHMHTPVETVDLRKAIEDVSGRAFERFFHDWTERPGHPKVTVRYKWLAEDKLARINVEQTQEADAFSFPLKLEFQFDENAEPRIVTLDITDKQTSLYIPLSRRPKLFRVDPDQAVLMELNQKKPHDLWTAQLTSDANPVARIAAAEHLAKKGADADLKLLATQLRKDAFWAVQAAIARELGKAKDDIARDALLAAVKTKHPKARAAVVAALEKYTEEADVESALLNIVKEGDASYTVETNAIRAYAKVCADPPLDLLESLLDRDSQNERIRAAALRAIGDHCDVDRFSRLIEWSKPGKPVACRTSAIGAMGKAMSDEDQGKQFVEQGMEILEGYLAVKSPRVQRAVLSALADLGKQALPLLPEIDRLAENGGGRIERSAKRAGKKIRESETPEMQLDDLRDQLADLQKKNKRLAERLKKIEAAQSGNLDKTIRANASE